MPRGVTIDRDSKQIADYQGLGNGELFNGVRISVLQNEKVTQNNANMLEKKDTSHLLVRLLCKNSEIISVGEDVKVCTHCALLVGM